MIGTDGDVEHFRPKQAYKQAPGEALQRPGYYWLAYEWSNLYLACTGCNQRHKQNLFPLENPGDRATNHHADITLEKPLLIDPGSDNPGEFIGFRGEIAYAIDGNVKGQVTIDVLKLNERSLPEARLQRLKILKRLWQIVQLAKSEARMSDTEFQKEAKEAKDYVMASLGTDSEFTLAYWYALHTRFEFVIG